MSRRKSSIFGGSASDDEGRYNMGSHRHMPTPDGKPVSEPRHRTIEQIQSDVTAKENLRESGADKTKSSGGPTVHEAPKGGFFNSFDI